MSQAVCYVEITLTRCARSSQSIGLCRAGIFGVPQSSSSRRLFPVVSQPWRLFRSRSVEGCPSGCSPARVCRHRAGPRPLGFVEPFGLSLAPRHCNENLGRDYQQRCGSIGHIQPGHCLFALHRRCRQSSQRESQPGCPARLPQVHPRPAVVHRRQIMSESVLVPGRPDLPRKQPLAHGRKLFLCSPIGPSRNICQSHSIQPQRSLLQNCRGAEVRPRDEGLGVLSFLTCNEVICRRS